MLASLTINHGIIEVGLHLIPKLCASGLYHLANANSLALAVSLKVSTASSILISSTCSNLLPQATPEAYEFGPDHGTLLCRSCLTDYTDQCMLLYTTPYGAWLPAYHCAANDYSLDPENRNNKPVPECCVEYRLLLE